MIVYYAYNLCLMLTKQEILFFQNKVAYLQDEDAYKKLFYHFHPILISFASSILNDTDEAEDVVSEVILKVWTMGGALNYIDNLTLYLFKSIKNKSIDCLRKKKLVCINILEGDLKNEIEDSSQPETQYLYTELNDFIQKVVSGLPIQCQLVFKLIKDQGFSYKEVMDIMQIKQNTIETHMRIALRKIRQSLDIYLSQKNN